MEIEEGEIVEADNVEKVQVAGDSRKRTSEGGINGRVAAKRMAVESGVALNNNLTPNSSVELAALQERVKKLERIYQPPIDNSSEMAALQEKLKKMERLFEGACRKAREAELRAERAEQIIDSKYDIRESVEKNKEIEQLQKKLAEISEELEKAKKREATRSQEDKKVIDELKMKLVEARKPNGWQVGDSKDGLRARIIELNRLLAESMRRERMADKLNKEQTRQLRGEEIPKDSEKSTSGTVSGEMKKQQEQQEQQRELNRKAIEKMELVMELRKQMKKQRPWESNRKAIEMVEGLLASVSEKTDDFLAILTPCDIPGKFIDVDFAAFFLNHKFYNVWNKRFPQDNIHNVKRECCKNLIDKGNFIDHFCGHKHKRAMAKGGGGVSIAALNQWVEAMEGRKDKDPRGKCAQEAPTSADDDVIVIEDNEESETPLATTVEDGEASVIIIELSE